MKNLECANFSSKLHMLQRVHQREVSVKSKKQITTSPRVGLIEMRLRPALDCLSMLSLSTRSEKSFGRPGFSEKKNPHLNDKPDIIMLKQILLLAAAIGFIAQSSVFAADPTPAPSPAKEAVTETASPSPSPAKTHRRQRVEARRQGRQTRREARRTARETRREARRGEATPTPAGAAATPTPKQ